MKKTEEKGVTIIALIITVAILAILTTIGTNVGIASMNSAKFLKYKEELKILQTKVNELNAEGENNFNLGEKLTDKKSILIGIIYPDEQDDSITSVKKIIFGEITSDDKQDEIVSGFNYFSKEYINNQLGLNEITQDFFINIEKRFIISVKGFTYKNKTYYMTQQLDDGLYNVEHKEKSAEVDFNINWNKIEGNRKYKIDITDISYDGYISNWQVKYKIAGDSYWKMTDEKSFYLDTDGIYVFKVVHGDEIESNEKELELFEFSALVGQYVKYEITYTDVATGYEFTSEDGWRILSTGKRQSDGTYNGVKLISTGIPAKLKYNSAINLNGGSNIPPWWGTPEQTNIKITDSSYIPYAVPYGLITNFEKLQMVSESQFDTIDNLEDNKAHYKKINGKTGQELNGAEFKSEKAKKVGNLAWSELQSARKLDYGDLTSTSTKDGAIGLFCLKNLNKYNYNNDSTYLQNNPYQYSYFLPSTTGINQIAGAYSNYFAYIISTGAFSESTSGTTVQTIGLRPVVTLDDNIEFKLTDKEDLWQIE